MAVVNSTYVSPLSATLDKAGGAVLDETMSDAWSSNFLHTHGTLGYLGCRASTSGLQSISNTTDTQINLDAESFDSDPNGAMHPTGAGNAYITIQTAGVYLVTVYGQFASNATGFRRISIRRNALTTPAYLSHDTRDAVATAVTDLTTTTAFLMAVSDTIDIVVHQSSGGALNFSCSVSVVKL